MVGVLPLEGEKAPGRRLTTIEADNRQLDNKTPVPDDETTDIPEANEGRGKHVRKETEYVRTLREGLGVTGSKARIFPRGMRPGTMTSTKDNTTTENEQASAVSIEEEVEYAMATVVESTEGSMPTYEEAKKRPDWPKWQEAI